MRSSLDAFIPNFPIIPLLYFLLFILMCTSLTCRGGMSCIVSLRWLLSTQCLNILARCMIKAESTSTQAKLGIYIIGVIWCSSPSCWPSEPVVGENPEPDTGSVSHPGYQSLPHLGFSRYPFFDHPERKDE